MELGLHLKYGSRLATILGCVAAEREDAGRFIFRAHEKLTPLVGLERAVCIHLCGRRSDRQPRTRCSCPDWAYGHVNWNDPQCCEIQETNSRLCCLLDGDDGRFGF